MPRLRWGDDAPTGVSDARQRLVRAAAACVDRFGLTKTTIEDVAREAKVSRATIYRYFENRDQLMLEVILHDLEESHNRELDTFFDGVDTPEGFGEALLDATVYLLATIRQSPRLQLLLKRETPGVSSTIAGASEALFRVWDDEMRPYLAEAQAVGLLRADMDTAEAAEWILRAILSLLTVEGPQHHSPEDERRLLRQFVVPALLPQLVPAPSS